MDALTKHRVGEDLEELRSVGDARAQALVRQAMGLVEVELDDRGADDPRADDPRTRFAMLVGARKSPEIERFLAFEGDEGVEDARELEHLIDVQMVRHAQKFFEIYGLQIATGLLLQSLPEAYACARGAQVLYLTGELVADPARRVRQTATFLMLMFGPDPTIDEADRQKVTTLHAGRAGARAARQIRLFHAIVRHLLTTEPHLANRWEGRVDLFDSWPGPALGVPVNQEDQLGTMFTFTVSVFESLESMGIVVSEDDREAWFHVWEIASRHLGIGVESAFWGESNSNVRRTKQNPIFHLPLTSEVSGELMALIRERHRAPSHEGKILANALLREVQDPLPRSLKPVPASFLRYLAGSEVQQILGIRSGGWLQYWMNRVESARRLQRVVNGRAPRNTGGELAALIGREVLQQFAQQSTFGDVDAVISQPVFDIPQSLARTWGVQCGNNSRRVRPRP